MKIITKVVKGKGLGKKLGFPTLNFYLENKSISGVFAGKVQFIKVGDTAPCRLQNTEHKAAIFIGKPKTLNENKRTFEAHLFDFDENIEAGTRVIVEVEEKIRDIQTFANIEDLQKAIASDCDKIRKMKKLNKSLLLK